MMEQQQQQQKPGWRVSIGDKNQMEKDCRLVEHTPHGAAYAAMKVQGKDHQQLAIGYALRD
jgi:hypothetical protein